MTARLRPPPPSDDDHAYRDERQEYPMCPLGCGERWHGKPLTKVKCPGPWAEGAA